VRLRQTVGEVEPTYRYERDVEAFFRHSPAVVRDEV
jgi:UDP-glucose 4-epimerase